MSFLTSCVNVKNKKKITEFQLNIVLTDKIGQSADDKLPDNIGKLVMPLEPAGCPKNAYLPKAEITRYGLNQTYSSEIKTDAGSWRVFFQKFYGNTGVETRRGNIIKAFEEMTIGDTLIMNNIESFNAILHFEKLINTNPEDLYLILKPGDYQTVFSIQGKDIPVYSSVDTLLSKLAELLCNKSAESKQNITLFYEPDIFNNNFIPDTTGAVSAQQPDPLVNAKVNNHTESNNLTVENQGKTIIFPNGDKYIGEVLNGKPNGLGTKTFKNDCQISEYDDKKQRAESGDYLVGVWRNGEPQVCKLYDASGKYKFSITIGGE